MQQSKQEKKDYTSESIDFFSFKEKISNSQIPERYIDSIEYIKINSHNDDLLFKSIDRIKISQDHIYILDVRLKKLIKFNIDGYGIGTVGTMGQGPEEYLSIIDFDIDSNNNIYILDGQGKKMNIYDSNLSIISSFKLPFDAETITILNDENIMFGLSSWNKGKCKDKMIAITNKQLDIQSSYLSYSENIVDDNFWISIPYLINTNKKIFFNKVINNNVYEFFIDGSLSKIYEYNFGVNNVPDEYKTNIEKNLDHFDSYVLLKGFNIILDKYILGTIWNKRITKPYFVDRKSNEIFFFGNSLSDYDVSDFTGFFNNTIISYIYPGKYSDNELSKFPIDVINHIENDDFVVCLTKLK